MYYHCSPVSGLTQLQPKKPQHFDKDALIAELLDLMK